MSKKTQNPQEEEKAAYNPKAIESTIYEICKNRGYFEIDGNAALAKKRQERLKQEKNSDKNSNEANEKKLEPKDTHFCIMMPPPNVTGVLHIGHALTLSLQDIIVRYKRMQGFITLYQPGLDHAGIATQNIVEKQLLAKGIKKEELGREAFIKKVWEWKEESGGKITGQMQALGISPALSRARFTMDKGLQQAVREAFVAWYEQGLIYQGDYMVNWCTHDGALSDIEVEYEGQETKLYYIAYKLADSSQDSDFSLRTHSADFADSQGDTNEHNFPKDALVVATTRPETFFGDVAVMINPNDSRYAHLVGKSVVLPLLNKEIPIIADSAVDMEFGTGVVKVTPAHDINDYEVGKRHNLENLVIFDEKGIFNANAKGFEGRERLEAREEIVAALHSCGALLKTQDYQNQVGKCYRCGNIIEPYISKQWFVSKEVASGAIKRVNEGEAKFYPSAWLNNFNAWMRELRPWCISRQLWWGHRIPIWDCQNPKCAHRFASKNEVESSCPKCGGKLKQQSDVLDTWFSSGLWAFSTLGWKNNLSLDTNHTDSAPLHEASTSENLYNLDDLTNFYPNSLLITGFDILFFWVARMLFSGESLLGKLPFRDIYLHALVRDENGQKMSKSRGNVIDPLEMIEKYGADSLRFSLAYLCAQGRDIRLSTAQLEIGKNFANKLFNATQFLLLYAKQQDCGFGGFSKVSKYHTPLGRYAKSRLNAANSELISALESYRFNDGASVLYRFLWGEFCDWCIELAKVQKEAISELGAVLADALKLLHPYMPFISEELYHKLKGQELKDAQSIMVEEFPSDFERDLEVEAEFEMIKNATISLRRLKASIDLANKPVQQAYIQSFDDKKIAQKALDSIQKLARVESIKIFDSTDTKNFVVDIGEGVKCYLPLDNIDLSPILARLDSQKQKLTKDRDKLESNLKNDRFLANAPKEVVSKLESSLQEVLDKLRKIQSEIDTLDRG